MNKQVEYVYTRSKFGVYTRIVYSLFFLAAVFENRRSHDALSIQAKARSILERKKTIILQCYQQPLHIDIVCDLIDSFRLDPILMEIQSAFYPLFLLEDRYICSRGDSSSTII